MSLSPQWLDELRARISLSGVISRTTRLTKAGHGSQLDMGKASGLVKAALGIESERLR